MSEITRVGVDLAKNVIQVHAVDAAGKVVTNRQLKRDKFIEWCMQLPAMCLLAMESYTGAHHWARKLVTPYRQQGGADQLMLKEFKLRGWPSAHMSAHIDRLAGQPHHLRNGPGRGAGVGDV